MIGNELFNKMPEGVLFECLGKIEEYLAISEVHTRSCGSHQEGQKVKWILF